jgi:hypothetical protein
MLGGAARRINGIVQKRNPEKIHGPEQERPYRLVGRDVVACSGGLRTAGPFLNHPDNVISHQAMAERVSFYPEFPEK